MSTETLHGYAIGRDVRWRRDHEPCAVLIHHAGSVWKVIDRVGDDDYRVECIVGTVREGWIGGERVGTVRVLHGDYLRGSSGWKLAGVLGETR